MLFSLGVVGVCQLLSNGASEVVRPVAQLLALIELSKIESQRDQNRNRDDPLEPRLLGQLSQFQAENGHRWWLKSGLAVPISVTIQREDAEPVQDLDLSARGALSPPS
jgi:hypothetical protein